MKLNEYKIRYFKNKDKAFQRFIPLKNVEYKISQSVGIDSEGYLVPIYENWMANYFDFKGLVKFINKKTIDVQIYGGF